MDTQQGRVHDKVTLITGAASGMGESHARVLASQGAKVALADIADDKGTELAKDLNEKYGDGTAVFVHLDVTDFDNWTEAVEKTVEAFGHLEVLVNNAGGFTAGDVEEASLKDWDLTLAIDLTGTFYGMKAAVPELKKRETSSIINISSIAG
ncbi:MAG: SDR family NAD(P)-dependent oxidoreductase, partial [Corynebacterium kroppenstedtii]|nr:SDR family NAD(P)-dependent oxidoreductase [Corynebacterium kroppenstedtii]